MNQDKALSDSIRDTAIMWLLRQRDDAMTADDWEAFGTWLEADAKHLDAYDRAVEADNDVAVVGPQLTPGSTGDDTADNDNGSGLLGVNFSARWPAFGAIAAALLVAIVFWPTGASPQFASLETEQGEIREVAINAAVTMTMNGNTELALDQENATIRMVRGEASYHVDSAAPGAVRVEIEDIVLVDYGTIFNVVRDHGLLRVAVTEGAVMIDPEDRKILVATGQQITMQLDDRSFVLSAIAPDAVLAWQDRQLVFEDRTLASVIGDVERNFGTKISLAENVKDQKITGVISLANDEATVIADVAAVIDGSVEKTESGWYIGD